MILEKEFSNTSGYLDALSELSNLVGDDAIWFRGHAKADYKLLPSLARSRSALEREAIMSKRFKQNAYPFRSSPPQDEWEWLFLMQHFGVPTRLLDWTESPLVALYFAVNDDGGVEDQDAVIWALVPAKYNYEIPRIRPVVPVDIPCFGVDKVLDDYRPDQMHLETMTSKLPVAAIAHRKNERIMAQLGVFTIMHRDMTPLEELASSFLARLVIPASSKIKLKSELSALRINKMSLFPELTSVAAITKDVLR